MSRAHGDGGLVIPGSFASASIAFRSTGLEVSCRGETARLDPSDHDPWGGDGGTWHLGTFRQIRNTGGTVAVHGEPDVLGAVFAKATRPFTGWERRRQGGTVVPLCTDSGSLVAIRRDRETLLALVELLRTRPVLLGRLAVDRRVQRLATDLQQSPGNVGETPALRWQGFDMGVALRTAGFVHPIGGRPFPGDPLPSEAEVVESVALSIARRERSGPRIDRSAIAEGVRRNFLDVEPWPFQALTDTLGT